MTRWDEQDAPPVRVMTFEPPNTTLPERAAAALRAQQIAAHERERQEAEETRERRLGWFRGCLQRTLGLDLTPREEHVEIDGLRLAYFCEPDAEIEGIWLTVPCTACPDRVLIGRSWARVGGTLVDLADLGARLESLEAGKAHLACDACFERRSEEERHQHAAAPPHVLAVATPEQRLAELLEAVHELWHDSDEGAEE